MKISNASTLPALISCSLHVALTAICEIAPMAYSKMFSFDMNSRAAPRRIATASVFAMISRLASQLARLARAPRASLATFLSSPEVHLESALRISWMAPHSPSCDRSRGSVARFPKTPQASLRSVVLSENVRIPSLVASTKPRFTMSSRYCGLRQRPRTMPSTDSCKPAWRGFACKIAAKDVIQPQASRHFCTSPLSAEQTQSAEAMLERVSTSAAWSKVNMSASTPP
mmetsp:Transcript_3857/g.7706  ORF Transcript_3857/g.7706 Transcript_3857/m.7706 type:complete len:228 (-) Transcript_3857:729-1412(-)